MPQDIELSLQPWAAHFAGKEAQLVSLNVIKVCIKMRVSLVLPTKWCHLKFSVTCREFGLHLDLRKVSKPGGVGVGIREVTG